MRIWVYVLSYNEEKMIPYFLQHYNFAEKIIVYDNYSNDKGPELLKTNKKIDLRYYDSGGQLDCAKAIKLKNSVWKEARGKCDYVILVDMDEFLYVEGGMIPFLRKYRPTIVKSIGYEMVPMDNKSINDDLLINQIKDGVPSSYYNKTALFSPNKVEEINYSPGGHKCAPKGTINYAPSPVLMLHYKYAFGPEYIIERYKMYASRMVEIIKKQNFGSQYLRLKDEDIRKRYRDYQKTSKKVI